MNVWTECNINQKCKAANNWHNQYHKCSDLCNCLQIKSFNNIPYNVNGFEDPMNVPANSEYL